MLLLSFNAFSYQALPTGESLAKERAAFRDMQLRDERGVIKPDGLAKGIMQRRALIKAGQAQNNTGNTVPLLAGISSTSWTALGPGNIGGRVRAIAAHPTISGKLWAGTAGGGIWTTSNGGTTWAPVNDFMGSLAVQTLAIDPTNANIMYAGTGEATVNADALRGAGIFKSTDGGVTWNPLATTIPSAGNPNWYYIDKVAIHPTNGSILLAATADMNHKSYIYRSADGGTSWSLVYSASTIGLTPAWNQLWSPSFDPNNGNNVILGDNYGGVVLSTDAGLTWPTRVNVAGAVVAGARVEVEYAKSAAGTIYASVDNSPRVAGSGQIWKSINSGLNWTLQSTPGHLDAQGWYANAIWVDPTNAAHLVIGGLDLWQSTNSGTTWTKISDWTLSPGSPHADHHVIVSDPGYNGTTNKTVYNGNDGGVYSAADITLTTPAAAANGWANLNNGFAITQFYSAAGSAAAAARIVGGTQDNGALTYTGAGTNWFQWNDGDGGFSAVDSTDATGKTFYDEYVYLNVYRTLDGGATATNICNGITDANPTYCNPANVQKANFIAPFIVDPNNNKRMLAGGESLWQTTNATAAAPVWTNIYNRAGAAANDYISAITVDQGDPNKIWIGTDKGTVAYTINGTAPAPTWTVVAGLPARYVFRILVDKNNLNSVYVSFGGYAADNLYHSVNGGSTWSNITGVLPAVPIRSITMHPLNSSWLYAGTEVGIFTSKDSGATWSATNDGPANVSVEELSWMDNNTLLAGTHGRGMYKATVPASPPALPLGVTAATGNGQNTISWTNVAGATSYNIYWSTVAGVTPLNGTKISNASTPYIHTALANGTAYYYVVTAVSVNGDESAASAQVTATPLGPPTQPLGVTASAGDGQDTISWTNLAGAANYNIYWSTTPGVTKLNGSKISNASNPYIQTGLTNGTTYYYVVTASNASGESPDSAQVAATPAAAAPAPAPSVGGGGGGGCSVMPAGSVPDSSLPLAMLIMLGYWMRRRSIRSEA